MSTSAQAIQEGAWLLTNVLTHDECESLQRECFSRGLDDAEMLARLRVMQQMNMGEHALCEKIWERIEPLPERGQAGVVAAM